MNNRPPPPGLTGRYDAPPGFSMFGQQLPKSDLTSPWSNAINNPFQPPLSKEQPTNPWGQMFFANPPAVSSPAWFGNEEHENKQPWNGPSDKSTFTTWK
jgi:hypothetical protein